MSQDFHSAQQRHHVVPCSMGHGGVSEQGWYCLQGRVWSGKRALEVGLVDALGGLSRAVAIAKRELKIPDGDSVTLIELSREQMSPLMLLSGGASANVVSDVVQVRGFLI